MEWRAAGLSVSEGGGIVSKVGVCPPILIDIGDMPLSSRHRILVFAVFLFLVNLAVAVAEEKAPPEVLKLGMAEARRQHARAVEDHKENPDIRPYPPKLVLQTQTVNFLKPAEKAWMLLYHVADIGPRAHIQVSELVLISARDSRVILAWPAHDAQTTADENDAESAASECDDARLVKIAPGRFAIALSYDVAPKSGGAVGIFSVGAKAPSKVLWSYPGEHQSSDVSSEIYFVRLPSEKTVSLAVRRHEVDATDDAHKVVNSGLLFRLDVKSDQFVPAEIEPARLESILERAEKDSNTPSIFQTGPMSLENEVAAEKEAEQLDKRLNAVYTRLRKKLSDEAVKELTIEEKAWLEKRDAIEDLEERNDFVKKRVQELSTRAR